LTLICCVIIFFIFSVYLYLIVLFVNQKKTQGETFFLIFLRCSMDLIIKILIIPFQGKIFIYNF
jgi:hypothetical protein